MDSATKCELCGRTVKERERTKGKQQREKSRRRSRGREGRGARKRDADASKLAPTQVAHTDMHLPNELHKQRAIEKCMCVCVFEEGVDGGSIHNRTSDISM